jgi:glutamyl-tRNA reductase
MTNMERKGRDLGIMIEEEYNQITKKRRNDRLTQIIAKLQTKVEKIAKKHSLIVDDKWDSVNIISDMNHITYYLTKKEYRDNELGLKIMNNNNNSNINNILRELVPDETKLYRLIAPDPTRNSVLTQTILYCLAYYIIWLTDYTNR